MRYVYFTKLLKELDVPGLIAFCKEVGLDGVDLAVRPGYPIHPDNVATALPAAAKQLQDAGLYIGLVSIATNLNDATHKVCKDVFAACSKAGVAAVKIGYFPYQSKIDEAIKTARIKLQGFARLAEATHVKACVHTHSGNNVGANAGVLRMLLNDLDPHHLGAYADTGHLAVNGCPIRIELDLLRQWLSLIAIKDMLWAKTTKGWQYHVVPAGDGIVHWPEFAQAVRDVNYQGTISLHGEYETRDIAERKALAQQELAMLKKLLPV